MKEERGDEKIWPVVSDSYDRKIFKRTLSKHKKVKKWRNKSLIWSRDVHKTSTQDCINSVFPIFWSYFLKKKASEGNIKKIANESFSFSHKFKISAVMFESMDLNKN